MTNPSETRSGLVHVLQAMADDAVEVQRRLDRDFEQQVGQLDPALLELAERGFNVLPNRQSLASMNIDLQGDIRRERELQAGVSVGLSVLPIGISYQRRFANSASRSSRLKMEITAQPVVLPDPAKE